MVDDRYEVALPWKQGFRDKLLNNEKLARSRLSHLSKKSERDLVLKTRYNSAIKDEWDNGIIEEVPREESVGCGPVFYMPHRPVIKESSVSTKVRPVFDASAKGFNGLSLNDCMEVGPCLLSNLTEILLWFRRWQIAITSDIEKAFLQIGVKKDDCDVHRFFWDVNGTTKVMRFTKVAFGNCSSPFLLNATVQFHLSGFPESRVVEELKENMYVDDFLSGADSVEECCTMVKDAIRIMSQASMPLVKWTPTAWVQRFIQNLKSSLADRWMGDLSFDELQTAKQCLICAEQENAFSAELDALRKGRKIPKCSPLVKLSTFVAEDGFLRVQGRLQFSQLSWEEKHPIILPKSHLTLLLTRFQHSLMKHAGVSAMISSLRNPFWILGVRRLAKHVKRECVHCKRQDSSPCQQPMSDEPLTWSSSYSVFPIRSDWFGPCRSSILLRFPP